MIPVLYILFVLSGAAGLFYESVWGRYLSLFVGHGAYAQVIVLVIFLGGMALGAALVSRTTERVRDPLRTYAFIELGVGLVGLVFHDWIYLPVTGWAYDSLFPALGGGAAVIAIKWLLAGLLILPQSILLGTTFPLMSAGVLRRAPERPGTVLSFLYFSNSLGAAVGVLVAGFVLVQQAGLPGTLVAAAVLNLVVGLVALTLARFGPIAAAPAGPLAAPESGFPRDADLISLDRLTLLLALAAAGTATASFIYEIAWIRLLSLVLGSATHSFELMLSAFILGLSLGAFWIRRRAESIRQPLLVLAGIQLLMGGLAIASLALYERSFWWMESLMRAMARNDSGYNLFTLARYGLCLVIMLPATFCAGTTLPLITRTLFVRGAGEPAIGQVYAWNTAGSILGAALASLALVPFLGLKATLILGGVIDILIGVLIAATLSRAGAPARRMMIQGAALAVVIPLLAAFGIRLDRALLTSGVFRSGRVAGADDTMLFYRDGRTATVSVARSAIGARVFVATNGKPDGSLEPVWFRSCSPGDTLRTMGGDDPTQVLLPLIVLAHRPDAKQAAVVGHGTGMSSNMFLASPRLESLVTVEIEPAMVQASRAFLPANRRVYEDPRAVPVYDDAKAYFAAANRRFDIIMAEPSNPWVSGVSGLFTTEFYGRVRRYLAPNGVLGQWLHTYELTDDLVLSVLTAIHRNFSDWSVYMVNGADLLIVASKDGPLSRPDWSVFELDAVKKDLCHFYPISRSHLNAALLTTRSAFAPLLDQLTQPNSDFYPILDLGAERARFTVRSASGLAQLSSGLYDFVLPPGRAPAFLPDGAVVSSIQGIPRVWGLVTSEALRRGGPSAQGDTAWGFTPREEIDSRIRQWLLSVKVGEKPASWPAWLRGFWNGFAVWHSGTRGWVDTAFVNPVHRFLDRTAAPNPVRAAVAFRERLALQDFAGAMAPASDLVSEIAQRRYWLDPAWVHEGAVLAFLAAGRPDSAAALDRVLRPHLRQNPDDLRSRLLAAWILASTVHDTASGSP